MPSLLDLPLTLEPSKKIDWREDLPDQPGQYYWRVESYVFWSSEGPVPSVAFNAHRILKQTPKGVWVDDWGRKRFILNGARKRWAYPTKQEAWDSFLIRLRWRRQHQERALDATNAIEKLVEENKR